MSPIILDFTAIDDARRRRRDWRLAFIALFISAIFTASLVGPFIVKDSTRIINAMCVVETVL